MTEVLYELRQVSYHYPSEEQTEHDALNRVDLTIYRGEALSVVGPSGCGKSTLLYLLAGLRQPTAGVVFFEGKPLCGLNRKAVLILQDYGLFPWKTVLENVSLGLLLNRKENKLSLREIQQRAENMLNLLGITEQKAKFPTQLSGGQRQRVAIARALIMDPEVLLMDEPFAALDAVTKENLKNLLREICRKRAITLVFVTHNIEEAIKIGERILVFGPNPDRRICVFEQMQPRLYQHIEIALGIGGTEDEA